MNTNDTAKLSERLYRAWCPPEWDQPPETDDEATIRSMHRELTEPWVAAILPIVAEEVRKEKADAFEEALTQEPTDKECIAILNAVTTPFGEKVQNHEWAYAGIQRCREAIMEARRKEYK